MLKPNKLSISAAKRAAYYYDTKRRRVRALLFSVKGIAVALIVYVIFFALTDRQEPRIITQEIPRSVGNTPQYFQYVFEDQQSGLARCTVEIVHAGARRRVFERDFIASPHKEVIQFSLSASELELIDKSFQLELRVVDAALFSNEFTQDEVIAVDYDPPTVKIIDYPRQVTVGTPQVVLYETVDRSIQSSGVRIGAMNFEGYPAYLLDNRFVEAANLYFAFFSVPEDRAEPVVIYSKDMALNEMQLPLKLALRSPAAATVNRDISAATARTLVHSLYSEFCLMGKCASGEREVAEQSGPDGIRLRVRIVAERYADSIDSRIREITRATRPEALWVADGFKNTLGASRVTFGSRERFVMQDIAVIERKMLGSDFHLDKDKDVKPLASGVVLYAGRLGPYGEVVIVDHGFGLSSLYAHLLESRVTRGSLVTLATSIGKQGASGFTTEPVVHLQMRVHGVPTNPENFFSKVSFAATVQNALDRAYRVTQQQ